MMQKSRDSSSDCHNELEWKQMQENARLVRLDGARGRGRKGYVGVRQRASGRWVAEIKDTVRNIRVWLGTFDTSEEAARAYDEAACILRGAKTRTNFWPRSTSSDTKPALPSKISNLLLNRLGSNGGGLSLESSSYDTVRQGHETHPINASTSNHLSYGFDYTYSGNEVKRMNDFDLETSWTEVEREGGEGKEAKKPRITDYLSLDAIKPTSEYTSLEIAAQEMSSGSMKTNQSTDKSSMLSEQTDRMKYERSNSASLYGFNEISECLKLKLGTGDANSTYDSYHSWNLEENPDEKSNAYETDQVADKQQTSNVSNCSSSNSATSSASIDGNELSLWSSLDLPPITVLFGAQLSSISF